MSRLQEEVARKLEASDRSAVVVVGGGGHGKVVIEILRAMGQIVLGFTDPDPRASASSLALRLGGDEVLKQLRSLGFGRAFVALGENAPRRRIGIRLLQEGFELPNAIHPSASVSPTAVLGRGVAIMAGAVVNADTRLGDFVVLNTGATVDHDCILEEACHVAPGCHLSGFIHVGEESLLGVGSAVGRGRPMGVGKRVVLGTGTVAVHDVPDGATLVGHPARPLRSGQPANRERE